MSKNRNRIVEKLHVGAHSTLPLAEQSVDATSIYLTILVGGYRRLIPIVIRTDQVSHAQDSL